VTGDGLAPVDAFSGALNRAAGESVGNYAINKNTLTIVEGTDNKEGNYTVTYVSNDFSITSRPITIIPIAGQFKTYGDLNPVYTYNTIPATGSSLPNGLIVGLSGALTRAVGEPVGTYAILHGGITNTSNPNYNISFTENVLFEIKKLAVDVTAQAKSKSYGDVDPVLTFVSTPTIGTILANGQVITFTGNLSRVPGETVLGGPYAIGQNTFDNSNYTITYSSANLTIIPKAITVTPNSLQSKIYGMADPVFAYTANPAIGSNLLNGLTVSLTGALTRVAGETVGNYGILQGDITNTANPNYNINFTSGVNFEIKQASTTTNLITSAASVRYMDNLTMTAQIVSAGFHSQMTALTGTVEFFIGGVSYGTATVVPIPDATDGSVQAMMIKQVTNLPANYTVNAVFTSTNANYTGGSNTKQLTVIQRNASPYLSTGFYTGDLFAWTTGPSTSTATVTLVAALKDVSLPTGDLRSAKVTFYTVSGTTYTPIPSAQNLPVGLVDVSNGGIGTASAIVQLNIGSANATSFQIAVGVSGAYTNNLGSIVSQAIVTVSKPVAGGYIVGGGQVDNSFSSGYIKGASDVNTSYEFDIQYTKSGTNPKGKVKIALGSYYKADGTLDSKLHTYIITTNAIALLNVTTPVATGIFDAKANLVEQIGDGTTVPFSTVAIEGGSTFQMKAFQSTCDQKIAITLYRKAGGVWFSSYWNATTASTSLKPVVYGSNVYVSGGGNCTGSISTTKLASSSLNNTSVLGELVTFKATVSGTAGTPIGTITFKEGITTLATVNLVGGIASYSTSNLTINSHTIIGSYSGDLKNKASDSSPLVQTVGSVVKAAHITNDVQVSTIVGVVTTEATFKAYPNPFTDKLSIEFSAVKDTKAILEIYNIAGSRLEVLFDGPVFSGDTYSFEYLPRLVSSQIVLYKLTMDGKSQVGKVMYNERR
jgi:hypothetical protein